MPARQPSELLDTLAAAGLSVTLTPEKALKVTPAHALTDELRSTIRANKAQLVNYLDRPAANDAALSDAADPDQSCWPRSVAMSAGEIETFLARQARFTDKGVSMDEAAVLADKLVNRDRDLDDRRLCLECVHFQGAGRWRCGNWKRAYVAPDGLARELAVMLQRCSGFGVGKICPPGDRK